MNMGLLPALILLQTFAPQQPALAAGPRGQQAPSQHACVKAVVDDSLSKVPVKSAAYGEPCGAGVGICAQGLCCGQSGICSNDTIACDGTCLCAYSGKKSGCAGRYPVPAPKAAALPFAAPRGACGNYAARCPGQECCSMFGICTNNTNYCAAPSCQLAASPGSRLCKKAHKLFPRGRSPKYYEINATVGAYSPDGSFSRDLILVNGKWADFLIEAEVNQRVIVRFNNLIPLNSGNGVNTGASIHWHGMLQMNSNHEDGFVLGTQRPVAPGGSFVYSFVCDTPGTFWWHSHFKAQYLDGLKGQLIVRDPAEKVTWATDTTLVVSDFYSKPWSELLAFYLSTAANGEEPTPRMGVINGVSQDTCVSTDPSTCLYAMIKGTPGTCEGPQTRVRIVNSGGFGVFDVSIDKHRMMVVAVDAVAIETVWVDVVRLNNGQRYDVLICRTDNTTNPEPVWIRSLMSDDIFPEGAVYNTTYGVLYYSDQPPATSSLLFGELSGTPSPSAPKRTTRGGGDSLQVSGDGGSSSDGIGGAAGAAADAPEQPLEQPPQPRRVGGVVVRLDDSVPQNEDGDGGILNPSKLSVFHGNGTPIVPPNSTMTMTHTIHFEVPSPGDGTQYAYFSNNSLQETGSVSLLERIFGNPENETLPANGGTPDSSGLMRGWNVVNVTAGSVVDIIINNHDDGEHPLHLHGHWFWVMARGEDDAGDYTGQPLDLGKLARDTETIELNSYIVLRFVVNNPGCWILHCHIDWHLAAGLGWIFRSII